MQLSLLQPTVWRWMIWRTLNRRPRSEWENNWEIITSFTLQNTLTRSFIQKAADSPKKMWTRGKNDFCQMKWIWIFRHGSVSSTPVNLSVRPSSSVHNSFGFPFRQRLWDLTKRWEDFAADMEVHMVADMEVDMTLMQTWYWRRYCVICVNVLKIKVIYIIFSICCVFQHPVFVLSLCLCMTLLILSRLLQCLIWWVLPEL